MDDEYFHESMIRDCGMHTLCVGFGQSVNGNVFRELLAQNAFVHHSDNVDEQLEARLVLGGFNVCGACGGLWPITFKNQACKSEALGL